MYYKLWTYIEEIDEGENHYEDIGEPLSIGTFKKREEAEDFREDLHKTRSMQICDEHSFIDIDNEGEYGKEECRICGEIRKK